MNCLFYFSSKFLYFSSKCRTKINPTALHVINLMICMSFISDVAGRHLCVAATLKLFDTFEIKTSMSSILPLLVQRPPVCACGREECCVWMLQPAWCPTLGGSHLSADAWSPQQSECSAAVPICSTTGRSQWEGCHPSTDSLSSCSSSLIHLTPSSVTPHHLVFVIHVLLSI